MLWNAVPWHPHRPDEALTNRKPTRSDQEAGSEALRIFMDTFENAVPVAIGRVSQEVLERLGYEVGYIRHPSMGGHHQFRKGVRSYESALLILHAFDELTGLSRDLDQFTFGYVIGNLNL